MLFMFSNINNNVEAASSATVDYKCNTSLGTELSMAITMSGDLPTEVNEGEQFQLENFNVDVSIAADATALLKGVANPLQGSVTDLNLIFKNAVGPTGSDSLNIAQSGIEIPTTEIAPDATNATFTVGSPVPIGPITPADGVDKVSVSADKINTEIITLAGDLTVSCTPATGQNTVIGSVNIAKTEPEPEEPTDPTEPEPEEPSDPVEPKPEDPSEPGPSEPSDPQEPIDQDDKGKENEGERLKEEKPKEDVKTDQGKKTDELKSTQSGDGGKLPDTATSIPLKVFGGLAMSIFGGTLLFFRKRTLN